MAFGRKPDAFLQHLSRASQNMEHVVDEHECNAEPNTPGAVDNAKPGQVRDGRRLVGMGMAAATRGNPLRLSKANVRLDPDGNATVRMAMTDIGTGTYTIMAQIAAEMLGLPTERVQVELGDTSFPEAAGSGGSWGAGSSGSALFEACNASREKLARAAGMDPATVHFADGSIASGEQSKKLTDLVGAGMDADGEIQPGRNNKDFSQQSYGAHFAEVGVDADTGEVRLRRMLGVFTAGRKTARSPGHRRNGVRRGSSAA